LVRILFGTDELGNADAVSDADGDSDRNSNGDTDCVTDAARADRPLAVVSFILG
jgi:hypothetical protein